MVVNDPIADMLTRIRNAQVAKHEAVTLPASNTKKAIAKILLAEGYVKAVDYIDDGLQGSIKVTLKYINGKTPVIAGLKRISKPGLRVYARCEELPKVLGGLGIAIISTSKGLMTDKEARKNAIGGEERAKGAAKCWPTSGNTDTFVGGVISCLVSDDFRSLFPRA